MRIMKIAQVNIDNKVGAFSENADKMIKAIQDLSEQNPHFIVFQEMSLAGYPCEDLVQWKAFNTAQLTQLDRIVENNLERTVTIFGMSLIHEGQIFNIAVVINGHQICGFVPKQHLPEYGVFYDKRTFSPGWQGMNEKFMTTRKRMCPLGDLTFRSNHVKFAVEICEDLWTPDGPMSRRAFNGAELIFNLSASPFREGMLNSRRNMVQMRSLDNLATVVYTNAVGGNDSLVFDGGGFIAQNGKIIAEADRWKEQTSVFEVDLDVPAQARMVNTTWRATIHDHPVVPCVTAYPQNSPLDNWSSRHDMNYWVPWAQDENGELKDLIECLVMGLDGYMKKTGAFKSIAISLSGGRDSVMATIIAYVWAVRNGLDPKTAIQCYSQPTRFNSEATKGIAFELAEGLGTSFVEHPIEDAFQRELEAIANLVGKSVADLDRLTVQNCQARIRGTRMWNISNATGALWIQTGNMSEKASGYSTIGGDLHGGYSLLGNVKKTKINKLLEFVDWEADYDVPLRAVNAIELMLSTMASAELAENQEDERDLMPFDVLDESYALYVGQKMDPRDVWRMMCVHFECGEHPNNITQEQMEIWVKKFVRLFHRNLFKNVQSPQAVHTNDLDLDRQRSLQLPICHGIEWLGLDEDWIS